MHAVNQCPQPAFALYQFLAGAFKAFNIVAYSARALGQCVVDFLQLAATATREPLLRPVMRQGRRLEPSPALPTLQKKALDQLSRLHSGHKRLENPHVYPVGLTTQLNTMRDAEIASARAELERAANAPRFQPTTAPKKSAPETP